MLHVCLRLDLHVTSVSLQNQEWWTHCWRQVKRLATNTNCTAAVQPHRRQHSLSPLSLQFREELASSLSAETKREFFGTLAAGQQTNVSESGLDGTSLTLYGNSDSFVI